MNTIMLKGLWITWMRYQSSGQPCWRYSVCCTDTYCLSTKHVVLVRYALYLQRLHTGEQREFKDVLIYMLALRGGKGHNMKTIYNTVSSVREKALFCFPLCPCVGLRYIILSLHCCLLACLHFGCQKSVFPYAMTASQTRLLENTGRI